MIKRKPLVYVAGEAIELPSGDGLDFPDTGFVHIAEEENITGKKIFEVSPETKNISNPADATSKVPNTRWVQEAIVNAIATGKTKALAFKGIVEANTQLPLTHKQGWVYVVGTPGTYLGKNLEIWDTIVCIKDGESTTRNTAFNEDWWIIQADINGYVLGPGTTTNKNIAIFDGATGKRIKDSGISIDDLIELLESGFIVDSALSATSTNPVQNKVITQALNSKQSLLTFDNTPAEDSINPVTSNGIFEALLGKIDKSSLQNTVTQNGTNPVKSSGIFNAIQAAIDGLGIKEIKFGWMKTLLTRQQNNPLMLFDVEPVGLFADDDVYDYNMTESSGHGHGAFAHHLKFKSQGAGLWFYIIHHTGGSGSGVSAYNSAIERTFREETGTARDITVYTMRSAEGDGTWYEPNNAWVIAIRFTD